MATNKTLGPTGVTISIPAFTDQPDQRVNSNCIDKLADAVNTLTPTNVSVTLDTTKVASGVYAIRVGKIVFVILNNATPAVAISADTTIATLGVSATTTYFGMAKDINGNDVMLLVDTSGNLKIAGVTGAQSGKQIYGTFTYITSN